MTDRTCTAPGCDRRAIGRGLCGKHYQADRRRDDWAPVLGQRSRPTAERLAEFAKPEGDCIVWSGGRLKSGYGQIYLTDRPAGALVHRVAWIERHGPIPDGMEVCHRCDNPPCFKDEHLFLGTHGDNMADMSAKGRCWESKKTHCPQNHPYDAINTRLYRGMRYCKTCARIRAGKPA